MNGLRRPQAAARAVGERAHQDGRQRGCDGGGSHHPRDRTRVRGDVVVHEGVEELVLDPPGQLAGKGKQDDRDPDLFGKGGVGGHNSLQDRLDINPHRHLRFTTVGPQMVGNKSQRLTTHCLSAQDGNASQQVRGRFGGQAGWIEAGGDDFHSGVIGAFKAVDQRATCDGYFVTVSPGPSGGHAAR